MAATKTKPRFMHFDPKDDELDYSDEWGYREVKRLKRIYRELRELVSSRLPDEWRFDQIRQRRDNECLSLVFVFERDLYDSNDFESNSQAYDKGLQDLEFRSPERPRYKPFSLSTREVNEITMPKYRSRDPPEASYIESHVGQGEWGYMVNVLGVVIEFKKI